MPLPPPSQLELVCEIPVSAASGSSDLSFVDGQTILHMLESSWLAGVFHHSSSTSSLPTRPVATVPTVAATIVDVCTMITERE